MASLLATSQGMCLLSSRVKVQHSTPSIQLTSGMFGTGISVAQSLPLLPKLKLEPIVASRVCKFTGKRSNTKNLVSFSKHRTKKLQFVNLQYKKFWWEAGKKYLNLRLSTAAIRTIEKNGLDAVAKKAGIDLKRHK
ncbi:50S ribosomal protein L28 [Carex littledalei]|uniref:Large ribosomal subunit protein bL28c n=1 Tax=Carex littledalei TaxID=544730 RepID=A0A833VHV5_9POAL|nr:50S ribosomal protein L28 [Carex littledalei]